MSVTCRGMGVVQCEAECRAPQPTQGSEWWIGPPDSESLPAETMMYGEDTSRRTIDTVHEGSASLESALPSFGDNGTVWWSVLVPGSGHTVGDPVRSLVLITLVTMAITIWFSAVVGVSRALWGTLTRGWSLTGARAPGNGPARWPQGDATHPPMSGMRQGTTTDGGKRSHINNVYCTTVVPPGAQPPAPEARGPPEAGGRPLCHTTNKPQTNRAIRRIRLGWCRLPGLWSICRRLWPSTG